MTTFTEPTRDQQVETGTAMHVLDVFIKLIWNEAKKLDPDKIRYKDPKEGQTIRRFVECFGYAMNHYAKLTDLIGNYLSEDVTDNTFEKAAAMQELFGLIAPFDTADVQMITEAIRLNLEEGKEGTNAE